MVGEILTNDVPVTIGARGNGEINYLGIVDEVYAYDRVLSADEIQGSLLYDPLAVSPKGRLAEIWGAVKSTL